MRAALEYLSKQNFKGDLQPPTCITEGVKPSLNDEELGWCSTQKLEVVSPTNNVAEVKLN